ncbi:MAG: hypothetical protein KKB34_07455 [Bacteroidetes bacterium]|nr:hypothetical protein [Bacteroidota bacterium]
MSEISLLIIHIKNIIANLLIIFEYLEGEGNNYAATDLLYLVLKDLKEIENIVPETLHQ